MGLDSTPEGTPKPESLGKEFVIEKKGTNLLLPVEGAKVYNFIRKDTLDSQPRFMGVGIKFTGPDGKTYSLTMESQSGQITPLDALKDAPAIVKIGESESILTSQEGKVLSFGTPIMETPVDNTTIRTTMTMGKQPDFRLNMDYSGKVIVPGK